MASSIKATARRVNLLVAGSSPSGGAKIESNEVSMAKAREGLLGRRPAAGKESRSEAALLAAWSGASLR